MKSTAKISTIVAAVALLFSQVTLANGYIDQTVADWHGLCGSNPAQPNCSYDFWLSAKSYWEGAANEASGLRAYVCSSYGYGSQECAGATASLNLVEEAYQHASGMVEIWTP